MAEKAVLWALERRIAAGLAVLALALLSPPALRAAELKINPPSVEQGEVSLENNSAVILRRGRSTDAAETHFAELGYGVTDYWWTELEGHWESGDDGLRFRTLDFENAFRLAPQQAYWPETALFLEYDQPVDGRSPQSATVAALFREDVGPSTTMLNLLFERAFGRDAGPGTSFRYIGISTWQFLPEIAPGLEFFGAPGRLGHFDKLGAQDHRIGPVLTGGVGLGAGELEYGLGYLLGLTQAAPNGTLIWRLEYGLRF